LKKSKEDTQSIIQAAVNSGKIVSLKTFYLTDYGEDILKMISAAILTRFNRMDLMEISYTSAKELVINATKANLKRVMFKRLDLDINNPDEYEKGMAYFKENLSEDKIVKYKTDFKKYNFPVIATFYYSPDVLNIKIKNSFPLLEIEEERIRDKFRKATSFSSLIDFFMEYGDSTEGAGMGLTMVGILLDQSGIDRHSFSLYSSNKYQETIAKLEIPLTESYISKRKKFQLEMDEKNISADELRKTFKYNYKEYKKVE
jgi:hypothetical protein